MEFYFFPINLRERDLTRLLAVNDTLDTRAINPENETDLNQPL